MNTGTKISVKKGLNKDLNILAAKLGMPKTILFEKLTKVPVTKLKALLSEADEEVK